MISEHKGEEAGIKSSTMRVSGIPLWTNEGESGVPN